MLYLRYDFYNITIKIKKIIYSLRVSPHRNENLWRTSDPGCNYETQITNVFVYVSLKTPMLCTGYLVLKVLGILVWNYLIFEITDINMFCRLWTVSTKGSWLFNNYVLPWTYYYIDRKIFISLIKTSMVGIKSQKQKTNEPLSVHKPSLAIENLNQYVTDDVCHFTDEVPFAIFFFSSSQIDKKDSSRRR